MASHQKGKLVKAKHGKHAKAKNNNLMKKVEGDEILVKLTGRKYGARHEYVKQVWKYIKKHNLQTEGDGRIIVPDEKLATLMGNEGKEMNAFTMSKFIEEHLVK